jgi:hypothetical protein
VLALVGFVITAPLVLGVAGWGIFKPGSPLEFVGVILVVGWLALLGQLFTK